MNNKLGPTGPMETIKEINLPSSDFKEFDYRELPPSFFIVYTASRRSGKTTNAEHLINQFQKDPKRRFDVVFLFSLTGTGFEGIPEGFRYDTLEPIDGIIEKQKEINEYNLNARRKADKVRSHVLCVIDDFATSKHLRNNDTLEMLAMNGRHIIKNHGSLSIILMTQSLTAVSRKIRLNCDCMLMNAISSAKELEMILDEYFYVLDSSRQGKAQTKKMYHELVSSKDYIFIVVENWRSNKRKLEDYIKTSIAQIEKPFPYFNPF